MVKGEEVYVAKTISSKSGELFSIYLLSFVCGFAGYWICKSVGFLPDIVRAFIGAILGYGIFVLQRGDYHNSWYSQLEFAKDYLVVHYVDKPKMKVWYKDIVSVNLPYEEARTSVTLTGDYPVLNLTLYKLENNAEEKFIRFLSKNGL